jgi:hypothetical protein
LLSKSKKNTFGAREIGDAINNVVIKSLRPASMGTIPEARLRKLRAYSQGLLAPLLKHIDEDILRPEEVVMVLATAALFTQLKYVMRTDRLPMGPLVNELYEGKEAVVLPEQYLATAEPEGDEVLPRIGKVRGGRKKV